MDAARAAVSKITGRQGHRTDVDEVVNPAVVSETIKPHRHEETQEAIDREVHQHHYHTTVQPVSHKEQLPEKHVHNLVPQVEREFKHDNEQETHRRVSAEMAQFQNTSVKHQTTHSTQAAPQVVGEHVHHHVHETVQPVIHKETIQPEVVHTTVPIHEVHHESAQHHGMSALPMKTIDEFKQAGGMLSGSKSHTHEEYEGAPRPYNDKLKTTIENVLPGHHHTSGTTDTTGTGLTGRDNIGSDTRGTGLTGHNTTGTGAGLTGRDNYSSGTSGSGLTGHHNTPGHTGSGTGLTGREEYGRDASGYDSRRPDSGIGSDDYNRGSSKLGTTSSNTSGTHKPSLMDKLNPRVDATGDGKAGFMK